MIDARLGAILGSVSKADDTVQSVLGGIKKETLYMLRNDFKLCYVCLWLPIAQEKNVLMLGPYLSEPIAASEILEIAEKTSLTTVSQKLLTEYYASVPVVHEKDRIFEVINVFCEHIWHTSSFSIVKFQKNYNLPVIPRDNAAQGEGAESILASAEMMEMRYAFENELIRAVALGQLHKESMLAASFDNEMFEKRVQDPVRNAKNYCIIMNTILRKAAEQGGVHPLHIDSLSSKFAAQIELITSAKLITDLMREMFTSYCRLVHKHSMKRYSSVVKKAVIIIESDLSAELSLSTLAAKQGISSGYLATVFKKETGKTVSEYVRDKRIEHAKYLLGTTNLQIQTVALYCGIMDVQYFSKIFKNLVGQTPKAYRETSKTKT
jgi:YesN/AraC family two-component response regulator